ncbi:glutaredoxin domain-containing protein [Frigoribacterium sp. RIT-PI-h]|uniref:glutaredoxin domain-containing protein n=1 Tax=Frigoribacterium sp. RIT-PI-h TaxID=1690245 RepID=UPI0006B9F1B5|nr:glutaredoxin domain-containing protein [Frigoribacterium sp. RIT-PI-h]
MITVYKKPQCFQCDKTIEKFQDAGLAVNIVDVTENPDALVYIKEDLGYLSAPVVVVSEHDHWSGLRLDNIMRVIAGGGGDDETVGE